MDTLPLKKRHAKFLRVFVGTCTWNSEVKTKMKTLLEGTVRGDAGDRGAAAGSAGPRPLGTASPPRGLQRRRKATREAARCPLTPAGLSRAGPACPRQAVPTRRLRPPVRAAALLGLPAPPARPERDVRTRFCAASGSPARLPLRTAPHRPQKPVKAAARPSSRWAGRAAARASARWAGRGAARASVRRAGRGAARASARRAGRAGGRGWKWWSREGCAGGGRSCGFVGTLASQWRGRACTFLCPFSRSLTCQIGCGRYWRISTLLVFLE